MEQLVGQIVQLSNSGDEGLRALHENLRPRDDEMRQILVRTPRPN